MTKRVAITIAGAVSLGSYEAGAMYEVLDALAQHNTWADETGHPEARIEIDILTGASAGGMTAAIVAYGLLFDSSKLAQPYDNILYNAWVQDIDLSVLLARRKDEDITHSILSSDCIVGISQKYLTPAAPPAQPQPHPAVARNSPLSLGLAMSNLNGVDYSRATMSGGSFTYTRWMDQFAQTFDPGSGYLPGTWEAIRGASVACGAFPFAFRVQDVVRNIADYLSSPFLVRELWGGKPSRPFTYTDGGVFQNEPLGMAKNFVDKLPDGHLDSSNRAYLFIAPKAKRSDDDGAFEMRVANYKALVFALVAAIFSQSEFQDWAMAESVNDQLQHLDQLAVQLQKLYLSGRLDPATTQPLTTALLETMLTCDGQLDGAALLAARQQLVTQYAQEAASFENAATADAWRDALLVLELAAGLHEKDEMYIYDFVADPTLLAGGSLFAFTGFFDVAYRKHDYDYGRVVAQEKLRAYRDDSQSVFAGLHWVPRNIDPVNPKFNNLPMTLIDSNKRQKVYKQIMGACDDLFSELGMSWLVRKGVETFFVGKRLKGMLAL